MGFRIEYRTEMRRIEKRRTGQLLQATHFPKIALIKVRPSLALAWMLIYYRAELSTVGLSNSVYMLKHMS